jgi:hypothetical protein
MCELGKGFTERNLRYMRKLYQTFPIRNTLCAELSCLHYRLLMRIVIKNAFIFIIWNNNADSAWEQVKRCRIVNVIFNNDR